MSKASSPPHPNTSSPLLAWSMWALVSLFYGYQFFVRVSPGVMSEELMQTFQVTATALGVLTSSYYMVYAPLQLPLGMLMDRFGPRRLASFSVALCATGCIIFAMAKSLPVAQIGRMLMGAGSACAFLSCLKVSSIWLPPHRFTLAVGFTMMIGTIGATTANVPLAILIKQFGWQMTLGTFATVGFIIAILIYCLVRDQKPGYETLEPSLEKTPSISAGLLTIIKNPQCWFVALYTMLLFAPMVVFGDVWGVPYFMQRFCVSCVDAAKPASFLYIGIAFGAPFFAWLSDALKSRKQPMWITAISVLVLFSILLYGPPLSVEMASMLIFLAGFSLGGQLLGFTVICEIAPRFLSGTAVGFNNAICMLSGVLFQPCVGFVLDLFWSGAKDSSGVPLYSVWEFQCGMSVIPACALIVLIVISMIKETHPAVTQKR